MKNTNNMIKLGSKFAVKYAVDGMQYGQTTEKVNYKPILIKIANDRAIISFLKKNGIIAPTKYQLQTNIQFDGNEDPKPIVASTLEVESVIDMEYNFTIVSKDAEISVELDKYKREGEEIDPSLPQIRKMIKDTLINRMTSWINDYINQNYSDQLTYYLNSQYKSNPSFRNELQSTMFITMDGNKIPKQGNIKNRIGIIPVK